MTASSSGDGNGRRCKIGNTCFHGHENGCARKPCLTLKPKPQNRERQRWHVRRAPKISSHPQVHHVRSQSLAFSLFCCYEQQHGQNCKHSIEEITYVPAADRQPCRAKKYSWCRSTAKMKPPFGNTSIIMSHRMYRIVQAGRKSKTTRLAKARSVYLPPNMNAKRA